MKKQLFFCAIMAFLGLFKPIHAHAGSVMASDITWKYLGPDSFLVTLTVYTDCNGTTSNSSAITVTPLAGGTPFTITGTANTAIDVTPTCKRSCTRCSSPTCSFPYGISMTKYTSSLVLKGVYTKICSFSLGWSQSARAPLTAVSSGDCYIESKFNRCTPGDNSPRFPGSGVFIDCTNRCLSLNVSAIDNDTNAKGIKDSLVYSLVAPLESKSKNVSFISPYTWDKPLKFAGWPLKNASWNPPKCEGFHIDSETGILNFSSSKAEQTIISVLVEEYSRDASNNVYKKGEIRRDIELILMVCKNNKHPELTGAFGTNQFSIDMTAGTNQCFTINTYDPDVKDSVSVSWNSAAPLDSFVTEKKQQFPRTNICWNPDTSMIRAKPYEFIVTAKDDACPVGLEISRKYSIRVWPPKIFTIKDTTDLCGNVTITPKLTQGPPIMGYIWSGDDSIKDTSRILTHHYKKPGSYKWYLTTYGNVWSRIDSGVIIIKPFPALPKPFVTGKVQLCQGSTEIYSSPYTAGNTYNWSVNGGKYSFIPGRQDSITVHWNTAGLGLIRLVETNACMSVDSSFLAVTVNPQPKAMFNSYLVSSRNYQFLAQDSNCTTYLWSFGDGISMYGKFNILHNYPKDSGYKVSLQVTDSNGCRNNFDTSLNVFTSLSQVSEPKFEISIRPNPFHDQTQVHYHLIKAAAIYISLMDIQGRLIKTLSDSKMQAGDYDIEIDAQKMKLSPGTYILNVMMDNNVVRKEIIKLR